MSSAGPRLWSRCGCAPSSMWPAAGSVRRASTSAAWRFRTAARCSSASPIFTRIRKSIRIPNDSIRYRFRGTRRWHRPGWCSVAERDRCIGADFAIAEMDVVLRTVLQNFCIHTDDAADEKSHFRGVAHAPKLGGRVISEPPNVGLMSTQLISRSRAQRFDIRCNVGDAIVANLATHVVFFFERRLDTRCSTRAFARSTDEASGLRGANGHRTAARCESGVRGRVCRSRLCRRTARFVHAIRSHRRTPDYGSSTR